jgi:actin-like ATPase involved in cell morphogenesis
MQSATAALEMLCPEEQPNTRGNAMGKPAGGYRLGIDIGTTYTAAAVERDGRVEVISLGERTASVPSVIYLGPDGEILTGDAASRRGLSEPGRAAREFKRRIGDPTPLLLGGTPYSAEAVLSKLLAWVIGKVTQAQGGPPSRLAVTHPANWGPYKQDLLGQAIRMAEAEAEAITLTEPEAAAIAYAANERVEPGSVIAVYDLGGGTFDAAMLRKTAEGFAILGQPEGIERLGGIDFDEAVLATVRAAVGDALDQIDLDDPANLAALARLRQECVEAKEALSSDTDTSIAVLLPALQAEVRLTRNEFERMIRPTLTQTVDALPRALVSASVEPDDVSTVLLVGGSSRIPLVAELVSDAIGRPIAVDADPKHTVALGAARAAAGGAAGRAAGDRPKTAPLPAASTAPLPEAEPAPVVEPAPVAESEVLEFPTVRSPSSSSHTIVGGFTQPEPQAVTRTGETITSGFTAAPASSAGRPAREHARRASGSRREARPGGSHWLPSAAKATPGRRRRRLVTTIVAVVVVLIVMAAAAIALSGGNLPGFLGGDAAQPQGGNWPAGGGQQDYGN